jgi:hypothetical protein
MEKFVYVDAPVLSGRESMHLVSPSYYVVLPARHMLTRAVVDSLVPILCTREASKQAVWEV